MTSKSAELRDYMEAAAEARRRGDWAAADAAEMAALVLLAVALRLPALSAP